MKTAIYIENGVPQVVLTPENDWETKALEMLKEGPTLNVKHGEFYYCQGGWDRHGRGDKSTILTVRVEPPVETLADLQKLENNCDD